MRDFCQVDGVCDMLIGGFGRTSTLDAVLEEGFGAGMRHAVGVGIRERILGLRRRADTAP
jgi:hypothetical protein